MAPYKEKEDDLYAFIKIFSKKNVIYAKLWDLIRIPDFLLFIP